MPDASSVEGLLDDAQRNLIERFRRETMLEMEKATRHADLGREMSISHQDPVWIFPYLHSPVVDVESLEILAGRAQFVGD
jgi:hypothetical protein